MHDRSLHVAETSPIENRFKFCFREAKPFIRVHLASLLKPMPGQIKNDNAAICLQNSRSLLHRALRMQRMVQRLREKHQVDSSTFNRQLFHIPQPILDIPNPMPSRLLPPHLDHLR